MSWLTPTLWWLVPLVAAPIVLHLLLRERVARVLFPSLRFLRRDARRLLVRRRWLEHVLLALRVVVLVVLIAAFARPFAGSGSGTEVAILLDVSRSMALGTRMEQAKAAAARAIAAAPPGASITVATFAGAGSLAIASASGRDDALALVRRAQPGAGGTDALDACGRLFDALRGDGGEIHLVSDLQATAFPRSREPRRPPRGFGLHVHRVGGEDLPASGSATVLGVSAPAELTQGERNLSVSVRVANSGPERAAVVRLLVDGEELDRRPLRLPQDGEAVAAALVGTVRGAGEHAGSVVLEGAPAALPGDGRFDFVVRVVERLRVAVVDGHPSRDRARDAAYFIHEALDAGVSSPFVTERTERVGDLAGTDLAVLASVDALPPDAVERLDGFVRRGGGLLIGLGPGLDPAAFNAALGALAPARLRAWTPTEGFLVAADPSHPLVAALAGDGKVDVAAARFDGRGELMDTHGARVVLRFDDGRPALLEVGRGAGTVMLFAGCLDRRAGDFPLRPLYVPFVREALRHLAARVDQSRALACGESIPVAAGAVVVDPEGRERPQAEGGPVTVDRAGIWRVRTADGERLHAVNGDPRESLLAALDAAGVERLLAPPRQAELRHTGGGKLERVLQPDERLAAERGLGIGWWLLIALAVLLPFELLVAQAASRT